jgi:hypothetical protein
MTTNFNKVRQDIYEISGLAILGQGPTFKPPVYSAPAKS